MTSRTLRLISAGHTVLIYSAFYVLLSLQFDILYAFWYFHSIWSRRRSTSLQPDHVHYSAAYTAGYPHMLSKRSSEPQVTDVMQQPITERCQALQTLKKKGIYNHNVWCIGDGKNELMRERAQSERTEWTSSSGSEAQNMGEMLWRFWPWIHMETQTTLWEHWVE